MMRTQKPLMLTALKFYTVSLQTFMKVFIFVTEKCIQVH